ncbi:unnamed protein product [Orchesella dallaii]|uniref:Gustatory receptor n=1 Tax=Orchesella dallaii TaxID=48710 RepID=A0ABP1PK17_9HEXA
MDKFMNIETLFTRLFSLCKLYQAVGVTWNPKNKKVSLLTSEKLSKVKWTSNLCILTNGITFIQILHHYLLKEKQERNMEPFSLLLAGYVALAFPTTTSYQLVCKSKAESMELYINGLLHFTASQRKKKVAKESIMKTVNFHEAIYMLYAWILYVSLTLTPVIFIFGFHWTNPCRSTILAWWVIPECISIFRNSESLLLQFGMLLGKFVVLAVNYYIWAKSFCTFSYGVAGIQTLLILKLNWVIKIFGRTCNNKNAVAKSIGNLYREIQVLGLLYNNIVQNAFLIVTILLLFCMSVAFTVLIRMDWTMKNALELAWFSVVGFNCILYFMVCVGGGMISIYTQTKKIVDNLKRRQPSSSDLKVTREKRLEDKWYKRFAGSCLPIRIKLGGSNYLEELTSLRCMECAVDWTIQLLLLM